MSNQQNSTINPTCYIQDLPVFGDTILAPMDGFSDSPYRRLARRFGSALSYTEFINARDVLNGHPRLHQRISYTDEERPLVFQIFDNDPADLLKAAIRLRKFDPDAIDINLGCSAKSVVGRGAGAGLLCQPQKVAHIFHSLSQALDVPVTGKIRLGWDEHHRNHLEIARIVEENGGKMVVVHGRTQAQDYRQRADWDAIAEVKQALSIPVIGNGDVHTATDIHRLLKHTRCDAVMIGRAAIGHPWIFKHMERSQVTPEVLFETMNLHLNDMLEFYDKKSGLVLFRKHTHNYLKGRGIPIALRHRLLTTEDPQNFINLLACALEMPSKKIEEPDLQAISYGGKD